MYSVVASLSGALAADMRAVSASLSGALPGAGCVIPLAAGIRAVSDSVIGLLAVGLVKVGVKSG
jgi:hypothetical protein